MRKTQLPAVAMVALVALAACGSNGEKQDAAAKTTTSPTVSAAAPDPYAPNLGDRALKVGQTRNGMDVHTTLVEVTYPYPPGEYRVPDAGNVFVGIRIKQCLDEDAEASQSTYNGEWSVVTPTGSEFAGNGSSWNDWPAPKFPETVGTIPGRCLKGWLAWQVPEGTKIESIIWRPDGDPVAEWVL